MPLCMGTPQARILGMCACVSLVAQTVKHLPAMRETWAWSLGWEDPLEKEMATHSSTLAWRIPRTEKPGKLPWGYRELDTTEWLHFQNAAKRLYVLEKRSQRSKYMNKTLPTLVQREKPNLLTYLMCMPTEPRKSFGSSGSRKKGKSNHKG